MASFPLPSVKYHIVNAKSGTLLDLSGTNQTDIIGWRHNGGNNQEWYIERNPETGLFAFRNARYDKFASFSGSLRVGAQAIGGKEKCLWKLREVGPELYRFVVPEKPYALELSNSGSKKDGTTIVIALQQPVEEQSWKFVKA